MSGTTQVSRYQKGKTRKVKINLDLLEQETVSGSDICWAICNAYSLRPPARSPPAGDTRVHLIPMVHTHRVPPCMAIDFVCPNLQRNLRQSRYHIST